MNHVHRWQTAIDPVRHNLKSSRNWALPLGLLCILFPGVEAVHAQRPVSKVFQRYDRVLTTRATQPLISPPERVVAGPSAGTNKSEPLRANSQPAKPGSARPAIKQLERAAAGDFHVRMSRYLERGEVPVEDRGELPGEPTVATLKKADCENASPSDCDSTYAVLVTGNTYAAYSVDGGNTYKGIDLTRFPAHGKYPVCCDQVTASSPPHDLMVWLLQYANDQPDHKDSNMLRLAYAKGRDAIGREEWKYVDLHPGDFGQPGEWFDYPSISVSSKYVFITVNVFPGATNQSAEAMIWRIPLSELAAGSVTMPITAWSSSGTWPSASTGRSKFAFGTRCTSGADLIMYCGSNLANAIRITTFDDDKDPESVDVSLADFTYMGLDGTALSPDGSNWAGGGDSRILAAWVAKGVLGFMWMAKQDAAHPYPYTIVALFDEKSKERLRQEAIWSDEYAILYPSAGVNAQGNVGGTLYFGGSANPKLFPYPTMALWIKDDFDRSEFPILDVRTMQSSLRGPAAKRWGDYYSVQPHAVRPNTWIASGYSLLRNIVDNGTTYQGILLPYVFWFGRERDFANKESGAIRFVTDPPEHMVTFSGNQYKTPYIAALPIGYSQSVSAPDKQSLKQGVRYRYFGGTQTFVTVGLEDQEVRIQLTPELQLITSASPAEGGRVELTRDSNAGVDPGEESWFQIPQCGTIRAIAQPGFVFKGWLGTGKGAFTGTRESVRICFETWEELTPIEEVAVFERTSQTTPAGVCREVTIPGSTRYVYAGDYRDSQNLTPRMITVTPVRGDVRLRSDDEYSTDARGVITKAPGSGTEAYRYFLSQTPNGVAPAVGGRKTPTRGSQAWSTAAPWGSVVYSWGLSQPGSDRETWQSALDAPFQANSGLPTLFLAINDTSAIGDNSGEFVVNVCTREQAAPPALVSPADASTITGPTVSLTWRASPLASGYDVYFGTAREPARVATVTATTWPAPALTPGQTYYWRVGVAGGGTAALSSVWSFVARESAPPPPPSGCATVAVQSNIATATAAGDFPGGGSLTLSVTASQTVSIADNDFYSIDANGFIRRAPTPGTGAYDFFLGQLPAGVPPTVGTRKLPQPDFGAPSSTSAFGALLYGWAPLNSNTPPANWQFAGTSATVQVPAGGGRLYLLINDKLPPFDNAGAFDVTVCAGTTPAQPPTLVSPADGVTLSVGDVVLRWSAAKGLTGSFDVYLGTSATPARIDGMPVSAGLDGGTVLNYEYRPTGLRGAQRYYWRIGLGTALSAVRSINVTEPATCALVSVNANSSTPTPGGEYPAGFSTRFQVGSGQSVSIANDDAYSTDANGVITRAPAPGTSAFNFFTGQVPVQLPPIVGGIKFPLPDFGAPSASAPFGALLHGWGPLNSATPPARWDFTGAAGGAAAPANGGRLYFLVNDRIPPFDNAGAFNVTVCRISGGGDPTPPSLLQPAENSVVEPAGLTLRWSGGSTTGYDVYFGTETTPRLVGTTNGTTFQPSNVQGGQTYYWRIGVTGAGTAGLSRVFSFRTTSQGAQQSCRTTTVPATSEVTVLGQWNATPAAGGSSLQVSVRQGGTVSLARNDAYSTDADGTITVPPSVGTGAYDFFLNQNPEGIRPTVGTKKNPKPGLGAPSSSAPYGALMYVLSQGTAAALPENWQLAGSGRTIPISCCAAQNLLLRVNDFGLSDNSGFFEVTACQIETPNPPQLTAPADNSTVPGPRVTLSWSAIPGVSSFDVYVAPAGTTLVKVATVSGTSYDFTAPQAGTYSWRVGIAGAGEALMSAIRRFTAGRTVESCSNYSVPSTSQGVQVGQWAAGVRGNVTVSLNGGTELRINAAGIVALSNPDRYEVDADGRILRVPPAGTTVFNFFRDQLPVGDPTVGQFKRPNPAYFARVPAGGEPWGALVYAWAPFGGSLNGNETWRLAGQSGIAAIPGSGRLYLKVNEEGFTDNSGSFSVSICQGTNCQSVTVPGNSSTGVSAGDWVSQSVRLTPGLSTDPFGRMVEIPANSNAFSTERPIGPVVLGGQKFPTSGANSSSQPYGALLSGWAPLGQTQATGWEPFGGRLIPDGGGQLFLTVNDNFRTDNSGEFRVRVCGPSLGF